MTSQMTKQMRIYMTGALLVCLLSGSILKDEPLKVTYIANCSFLYEAAEEKVLIDPFGTEYGDYFFLPSTSNRLKIIEGLPPFDNINLILITHVHGDHFNPFLAENYLINNRETKMICPPQVYQQMQDSCHQFFQIESQLVSQPLNMHESKSLNINHIPITAIRLQHGSTRNLDSVDYKDYTDYEKTENWGYVIRVANNTIFHQGDGSLKMNEQALLKIKEKIDVAYLSFFDWDSTSFQLIQRDLHPNKIMFMHGTIPGDELTKDDFKTVEPQLTFFAKELDSLLTE
jgi:L-ascorbate metabolism protein UlaG (beta-lactamase superfamily)